MINTFIGLLVLIVLYKLLKTKKKKPEPVKDKRRKASQEDYDNVKSLLDEAILMLDEMQPEGEWGE